VFIDKQGEKDDQITLPSLKLPVVMKYAPISIRERITEAAMARKMLASVDTSIPSVVASIIGAGASIRYERLPDFKKEYSMEIKGIPWCCGDEDVENMVM